MVNRSYVAVGAGGVISAAALSLIIATPAASQEEKMWRPPEQPEATFYRDLNFQGPAVYVNEPKPNLGLVWRVNSIRIKSGRWELCERTRFRGTCRTYDRDTIMLNSPLRGRTVQSIRPVGGWTGNPETPGSNQSLRGMAAQFYPAPAQNGYRVLACRFQANASCAAETADRFCAAMGWRASAREALETVRGRVYLADVLCSHTGY